MHYSLVGLRSTTQNCQYNMISRIALPSQGAISLENCEVGLLGNASVYDDRDTNNR